jgi:hypothetical protein
MRQLLSILINTISPSCFSQRTESLVNNIECLAEKYFSRVDNRISYADAKVTNNKKNIFRNYKDKINSIASTHTSKLKNYVGTKKIY